MTGGAQLEESHDARVFAGLAAAAMLATAGTPAAGQSGPYDYPGGYAGRFDGVSSGAGKPKGQVGASQTLTVGGSRTISVGGGAKRSASDPDQPVIIGTVPNSMSQKKRRHHRKSTDR
jgi:hypothetical protein